MRTVYLVKALDADTSNIEVTCVIASKKEARKVIKENNAVTSCFYCGANKPVRFEECTENRSGHVPDYEYWYQPVPMLS